MAIRTRIERRPLGEQVTGILRRMIVEGRLEPGMRLVEEQLAEQIGTSRTPIREALHRLEQEKLVERRAKGGYRVRPLTVREVEEVTGVRAALESYAVELAARRLGPEQVRELEENVAAFARALEAGDRKALVKLNTEFHQMLYRAAGSELLSRMIEGLAEVLYRFRVSLLADPQAAARSLRDHRRLLAALKAGRGQEAARICREHLMAGGAWMSRMLQEQNHSQGD